MATKLKGLIWVIPGFCGSELWALGRDGSRTKLWLDVGSILQGNALGTLVWGATPPGTTIQVGGMLTGFGYGYEGIAESIAALEPQGYVMAPFPYDWRDSIVNLGPKLAAAIASQGAGLDNKIMCHSYGTLVTQFAMGGLKASGLDGLVSKIVSIGGIFSGSYGPVKAWREEEDMSNLLALVNAQNLATIVTLGGQGNQQAARFNVLTALCSWPSTYDMLVDPSGADDPGDTLRSLAWNAANWSACLVPPNATLMAASQNGFQALRNTPAYALDPSKWFLFVAKDQNIQTPYRMVAPGGPGQAPPTNYLQQTWANLNNPDMTATLQRRSQVPGVAYTNDGDNRGTFASQMRTGVTFAQIMGSHADLQTHPWILENLGSLLGLQNAPQYLPPFNPFPTPGQALALVSGVVWPQGR